MIKIVKPSDQLAEKTLVTVIYGQPGIGKTTLAATAEKPLMFDFDAGAHRAGIQCDIVACREWSDVADLRADDVVDYKTLIIDTGGQCVNALKRDIIKSDPRMATSNGGLTLNGYGVLKDRFSDFVAKVRSTETDLVIVMHATEQKDGDSIQLRLDVAGGSKDEIHRVADVMGLLKLNSTGERELVLEPSLAGYAKNPVGLDRVKVGPPWESAYRHALRDLLGMIRKGLKNKFEEQRPDPADESMLTKKQKKKLKKKAKTHAEGVTMKHPSIDQFDKAMAKLKSDGATLTDFNGCFNWLRSFDHVPNQMREEFEAAYKARGLAYSETTKKLIDPAVV